MRIGLQGAVRTFCKAINEPVFVVDEEGVIIYKNTLSHSIFQQISIGKTFTLFYPDIKSWHYFYHYLVKLKKRNCQEVPILNEKNELYYMNLNIIEIDDTGMFLIKILSSKSELQLSAQNALAYNNLMRMFNEFKQAVVLTDFEGNILTYNNILENLLDFSGFKDQFNYFEQLFDQFEYSPNELTAYYKSIGQNKFGELNIKYNKNNESINVKVFSVVYKDLKVLITTLSVQENLANASYSPIDVGMRMLGESTAKILHEINNPLTSLKGYIDLMVKKAEFNLSYLNIIQQELQKIELLTSDLLNLSNPRNDLYESIAIISLVEECIELLSVEAQRKECEFILRVDISKASYIYANRARLQQVIINLLKNSIEAIGQHNKVGKINIVIGKVLNRFKIVISDNGPGIKKEYLDKIFNSFFTTKESGTGLGLSISKQLIEEHNGQLLVESEEGKGTVFSIYIPVHFPIIPKNYYQDDWLYQTAHFDNV